MTFDILTFSQEELDKLTVIQMQLLRNAQKKKNELQHVMEREIDIFDKTFAGNGVKYSTLGERKRAELREEFEYQVEILREQLIYNLEINEPYPQPGEGGGDEDAGYIVDYSLPYADRYAIVREYYLSIEDPAERMNLYMNDAVARQYLGSYYSTLMNVLYSYSQ